jgi:hypothetical protein
MLGPVAAPLMRVTGVAPRNVAGCYPRSRAGTMAGSPAAPNRTRSIVKTGANRYRSEHNRPACSNSTRSVAPGTSARSRSRYCNQHGRQSPQTLRPHTILESLVRLSHLEAESTSAACYRSCHWPTFRSDPSQCKRSERRRTGEKALPQDAAVHVGLNHHLLSAMESSDLPDERILDHRQAGCQSLVKT